MQARLKTSFALAVIGIKDQQISTLLRIEEGLEIKPHILIKMIEDELGEDFSFLEN